MDQTPAGTFATKVSDSMMKRGPEELDWGQSAAWKKIVGFFLTLLDQTGPVLGILGLGGLLSPVYRRDSGRGWVLLVWALSGFSFWLWRPSADMVELMPGLVALAVAGACGAWPKPLIYFGAGFAALATANYRFGWIASLTVPLPLVPMRILAADPPRGQDWKIPEILGEAQRRSPAGEPWGLSVESGGPTLNAENFFWTAQGMGLRNMSARPATPEDILLSEFVVSLRDAARPSLQDEAWFGRAYSKARSWPIPDGGRAELFQRKRGLPAPLSEKRVDFSYYDTTGFSARKLQIDADQWESARSAYRQVSVRAAKLEVWDLKASSLEGEISDLSLVLAGGKGRSAIDEFRVLKIGAIRLKSLVVEAADLKSFLEARFPGLSLSRLSLDGSFACAGLLRGLAFSIEGSLVLDRANRRIEIRIAEARLGQTRIPDGLLKRWKTIPIPLDAAPGRPFSLDFPGLTLKAGRLTIP